MVTVRECLVVLSELDMRAGVPLEPWGQRGVRAAMCERLVRAEDELEVRRPPRHLARLRGVRRRLEVELWP